VSLATKSSSHLSLIKHHSTDGLPIVRFVAKRRNADLLRDVGRMARHATELRSTAKGLLLRASDMDRRCEILLRRAVRPPIR
jgi:hypothetical protein